MVEQANQLLEATFDDAWEQPDMTVRLDLDQTVLRVFTRDPDGSYSPIAESSDGVKAFVALVSFVHASGGDLPIVLVDEAENHLHYDAQADLVRMFEQQGAAQQVIYTTHSAGCLPDDLGSVRSVAQIPGRDESVVTNSFWTDGGGFSSLLLAMGASALAFTATRRALVSEGGADVVLLPSLLREALGVDHVGFQVVPGLADATERQLRELGLSAVRVVYLTDDDASGKKIRRRLRRCEVPEERMNRLGRGEHGGLVLEDTVTADIYHQAVNAELERSLPGGPRFPRRLVGDRSRPAAVDRWAKRVSIDSPSHRAVARRVLDVWRDLDGRRPRLLSTVGRRVLRDLYQDVSGPLELR